MSKEPEDDENDQKGAMKQLVGEYVSIHATAAVEDSADVTLTNN